MPRSPILKEILGAEVEAYAGIGFPPEIFAFYDDHRGLWAENVVALLARAERLAAGIADG